MHRLDAIGRKLPYIYTVPEMHRLDAIGRSVLNIHSTFLMYAQYRRYAPKLGPRSYGGPQFARHDLHSTCLI
jgi:hypothetical protein